MELLPQSAKVARQHRRNYAFLAVFIALAFSFCEVSETSYLEETNDLPRFAEPLPNITARAGSTLIISCMVDNLGSFRVAWLHADKRILLSLQNRMITRDRRISVAHSNFRTFILSISEVQRQDRGRYLCQINTSPMMTQEAFVEVLAPPQITESSDDTVNVKEGSNVTLMCKSDGYPIPKITWRREDGREQQQIDEHTVYSLKRADLTLSKVGRQQSGVYACNASNRILPSASKRIQLHVNFPPLISVPNDIVRGSIGSDVYLQCDLESYPWAATYWTNEDDVILREDQLKYISNEKYAILTTTSGGYRRQMVLKIKRLLPEDFGLYTCVADNVLGRSSEQIILEEIPSTEETEMETEESDVDSGAFGKLPTFTVATSLLLISIWSSSTFF